MRSIILERPPKVWAESWPDDKLDSSELKNRSQRLKNILDGQHMPNMKYVIFYQAF